MRTSTFKVTKTPIASFQKNDDRGNELDAFLGQNDLAVPKQSGNSDFCIIKRIVNYWSYYNKQCFYKRDEQVKWIGQGSNALAIVSNK